MPVPISTLITTNQQNTNDFYNKSSTNADNLANIYKEMLKNTNKNNVNTRQENLTAQIYFKNYIQESLRFLREKAKEHEAKLRNQISNTTTTTVTSLSTSVTTNTANTSQLDPKQQQNPNNKNLKIVKIQTNKRNINAFKQLTLNNRNTNKSMIVNKNINTNIKSTNITNNNLKETKSIENLDDLDDLEKKIKFQIVKPTVTNKCKLNEIINNNNNSSNKQFMIKKISCTNKKPQLVRTLDGQLTTNSIRKRIKKTNLSIKLTCDKNQEVEEEEEENSTNKTINHHHNHNQENIAKDLLTTTTNTNTNTPSSDMFYVKKLNRSVECLEDFNDFLRSNISYSHYCSSNCNHPHHHTHRHSSTRHRSKHLYPCSTHSRSTRYMDVDWEVENEKHLRRYERDTSERYCSSSSRYDTARRGLVTCTRKSRSKSKYRPDQQEETRSKVLIDEVENTNKNDKDNHSESFSPEIPVEKSSTSNVSKKKIRDKSLSILSKSSFGNSNYTNQESQGKSTNTTIAVQTTPSDLTIDVINESPYVKELKSQLETLKAEITRLQNAQTNLEKTLKQQSTVIRPIIYTGYADQNDYSAYTFDQFIQTDYKMPNNEQLSKDVSSVSGHGDQYAMVLPDGSEYYGQSNQPFIYDTSNGSYDEAIRTQLSQQMNLVDLNKSTRLKSNDSKNPSIHANQTSLINSINTVHPSQNTTTTNNNNQTATNNEEPNKLKQTILNKIDTDLNLKKNNTQSNYVPNNIVTTQQQQRQQNAIKYAQTVKNFKRPEETLDAKSVNNKYSTEAPSVMVSNSAPASTNVQPGPPSPNAQLYQKLLKLISSSSSYSEQINSQMNTLLSNPNIKAQLKQLHSQLLKNPNQYLPQLESILLDKSPSPPPPRPPPLATSSILSQPQPPPPPPLTTQIISASAPNSVHITTTKQLTSNYDHEKLKPKLKSTQQSYENYNKNQPNVLYYEEPQAHSSTQDLLDLRQYYARDEAKRNLNKTSSSVNNTIISAPTIATTTAINNSLNRTNLSTNLTQRSIAREFKHH